MAAASANRQTIRVFAIVAAVVVLGPGAPVMAQMAPRPMFEKFRFDFEKLRFNLDDKTPVRDLLPVPPSTVASGPLRTDDLARVPEVHFQEPFKIAKADKKGSGKERGKLASEPLIQVARKAKIQTAHQLAKIN